MIGIGPWRAVGASILLAAACSDDGAPASADPGATTTAGATAAGGDVTGDTDPGEDDDMAQPTDTGVDDGEATTDGGGSEGDGTDSSGGGEPGAASPVVPIDTGDGVTFDGGGYHLAVATAGARIIAYALDGDDVLSSVGPFLQTGSTLWVAPQDAWPSVWPLPTAHDADPYDLAIEGDVAVFVGAEAAGVSMRKAVSMLDDGTVTLTYTLTAGAAPVSWAPWEVTRLAPALCMFGTGPDQGSYDFNADPIVPIDDGDVTWVPFAVGNAVNRTLLADARGWSACATGSGGLLFVKRFPDVSVADFAPGNGEVKIWWQGSDYLELEQVGRYAALAAGASVDYTVTWSLSRLADDVVVAAQSPSLRALLPR